MLGSFLEATLVSSNPSSDMLHEKNSTHGKFLVRVMIKGFSSP